MNGLGFQGNPCCVTKEPVSAGNMFKCQGQRVVIIYHPMVLLQHFPGFPELVDYSIRIIFIGNFSETYPADSGGLNQTSHFLHAIST